MMTNILKQDGFYECQKIEDSDELDCTERDNLLGTINVVSNDMGFLISKIENRAKSQIIVMEEFKKKKFKERQTSSNTHHIYFELFSESPLKIFLTYFF